jgi:hypothetical protein
MEQFIDTPPSETQFAPDLPSGQWNAVRDRLRPARGIPRIDIEDVSHGNTQIGPHQGQ